MVVLAGNLSAMSSVLIIYIIRQSKVGLRSVYHRIILGMSIGDIFASSAMSLTSLPGPSHMPQEEEFGYDLKSLFPRYGNITTCSIQGFFIAFGSIASIGYYGMLCVYYACAIGFCMKEKNIVRYVEPILHLLPLLSALGISIFALALKMINTTQSEVFCFIDAYPNVCGRYKEVDCIRGSDWAHENNLLPFIALCLIVFDFVMIFLSLVTVSFASFKKDNFLEKLKIKSGPRRIEEGRGDALIDGGTSSKPIIVQALLYITVFVLTLIIPILRLSGHKGITLDKLRLTFTNLQGFFNLLIFMGHKIYNYRRLNIEMSIYEVAKRLLHGHLDEPVFITRIHIVVSDQNHATTPGILELQMEDELGARESFVMPMNGRIEELGASGSVISGLKSEDLKDPTLSYNSSAWEEYESNESLSADDGVQINKASDNLHSHYTFARKDPAPGRDLNMNDLSIDSSANNSLILSDGLSMVSSPLPKIPERGQEDDDQGRKHYQMFTRRGTVRQSANSRSVASSSIGGGGASGMHELSSVGEDYLEGLEVSRAVSGSVVSSS